VVVAMSTAHAHTSTSRRGTVGSSVSSTHGVGTISVTVNSWVDLIGDIRAVRTSSRRMVVTGAGGAHSCGSHDSGRPSVRRSGCGIDSGVYTVGEAGAVRAMATRGLAVRISCTGHTGASHAG